MVQPNNEPNGAEAATPASDKVTTNEAAAAAETPASEPEPTASDAQTVRSSALIIPVRAPEFSSGDHFASYDAEPEVAEATEVRSSRWGIPHYVPLAAGIVLAIAVGAIAGAGALSTLRPDTSASTVAAARDTRALQATVTQLNGEVAALKTALNSAQRVATAQMGKLTERLDRAEKAQVEPAAKLAKISESVDRIEKRQQQATVPASAAVPAPAAIAAADPDITGSTRKEEARPPVAEGWRLLDFYQGRAVVESRNGVLYEIGQGSNLPGLGKVESIKRENGRVVVLARNGMIMASAEQRRPASYPLYRY